MCDVISQDGCTPIYLATMNGHLAVVKLLIERKADVNIFNIVCFYYLSSHPIIKEILLNRMVSAHWNQPDKVAG